jgi:hypothetical protein
MDLPSQASFTSVFSQIGINKKVTFVNVSSLTIGNFTILMDIISPTGLLQLFGVNTTYNNIVYASSVTSIPGGGSINITFPANLSLQNCFNVTYFFNASGFDFYSEKENYCFYGYDIQNVTFTTGLFDDIDLGVAGKGVIATIILILALGGMLIATRNVKGTVLVGSLLVGALGFVGMYPLTISLLSSLGVVVLVVASEVVS